MMTSIQRSMEDTEGRAQISIIKIEKASWRRRRCK